MAERNPDLLIAAAAAELEVAVLRHDADFDRIASVADQQCKWVVSASSQLIPRHALRNEKGVTAQDFHASSQSDPFAKMAR